MRITVATFLFVLMVLFCISQATAGPVAFAACMLACAGNPVCGAICWGLLAQPGLP